MCVGGVGGGRGGGSGGGDETDATDRLLVVGC